MVEIKVLREKDIEEVLSISRNIFNPRDPNERHHSMKEWKKHLREGGLLLGAFLNGKLIGYNFGYPASKNEYHYWMGGVLDAYRGQGIGKALLIEMEKLIRERGFNEVTVNSYQSMWPVQFIFLQKYGYKIYKQEDKEWDDGKTYVKSYFRKTI